MRSYLKNLLRIYNSHLHLKVFGIFVSGTLLFSLFTTVYLVQQKQDIRQRAAEPTPIQGKVMFGAWVGKTVDWTGNEKAYEAAISKTRKIRHWYWTNRSDVPDQPGLDGDPAKFAAWSQTMLDGQIIMLSFAPVELGVKSNLPNVIGGVHDEYIKSWAQVLKAYGKEVWLRPMWEDNLGTNYWWASGGGPWDKKKNQYKQAFCHIKDVFTNPTYGIQTTNVKFVWSPNLNGQGGSPIMDSYPGNSCVDIVGLDGYPGSGGRPNSFYEAFKEDYAIAKSTGKPVIIAETGYNNASGTPAGEQAIADYMATTLNHDIPTYFSDLYALVWFNEKHFLSADLLDPKHTKGLEAFRNGIANPFYIGAGGLVPTTVITPTVITPTSVSPTIVTPTIVPTIPAGSKLINGEFENGLASWYVPSWFANFIRVDNTLPHTGNLSLHIQGKTSGAYTYQEVQVSPGNKVNVSGFANIVLKNNNTSVIVELLPLNKYNGSLGSATQISNVNYQTSGWVPFSGSIIIPNGAVKVRINIKLPYLDGNVYVDDISLIIN